jgi:bacterioferritin-associated ferredoxin
MTDDPTPVRRCVCGDVSFAELKDQGVTTFEQAAELGVGITCGLCRPYLERLFETGETEFTVLSTD